MPAERFGDAGRRLLALLALRGPTSRASVLEELWPTLARVRSAPRLRNTLWRLGASPDGPSSRRLVDTRSGDLALARDVVVDVHVLLEAARAVERGELTGVDARLFEADLLPTWDDDWLLLDRERIRQLRLHALEGLSATLLDVGRHAQALDAAITALYGDPLRESAHRAVIRVHLAEGNAGAALHAFEQCRTTLERELGVRPTPALLALMAGVGPGDPVRPG